MLNTFTFFDKKHNSHFGYIASFSRMCHQLKRSILITRIHSQVDVILEACIRALIEIGGKIGHILIELSMVIIVHKYFLLVLNQSHKSLYLLTYFLFCLLCECNI